MSNSSSAPVGMLADPVSSNDESHQCMESRSEFDRDECSDESGSSDNRNGSVDPNETDRVSLLLSDDHGIGESGVAEEEILPDLENCYDDDDQATSHPLYGDDRFKKIRVFF